MGAALFAALLLLLGAACSDDDTGEPAATPAVATATAPATAGTPGTGVAPVDAVIRAVEARDSAALAALVTFEALPCGPQQGPGSAPACGSQPPGTPVEVFPIATCEGELRTPAALRSTLEGFQPAALRLHGAYRVRVDQLPPLAGVYSDGRVLQLPRATDHVVVFAATGSAPDPQALAIVLAGGRIVGFRTGCGATAEMLVPPGAQPLPVS
ncbi:MAG: hypothetical protein FJ035_05675 [Chloroflexi bacterium]|nr:hypothetical protein [Chloroflexota bacterium]